MTLSSGTTISILLLDNELRIRRITSIAETLLNIHPNDVGRPIGIIPMQMSVDDVESVVRSVLETLQSQELACRDGEGRWHTLWVQPYRTSDNRIDGVVLLLAADPLPLARKAEAARELAESVMEWIPMPLVVLREDFRVKTVNRAFCENYRLQPTEAENQPFLEMSGKQGDLPELRRALEQIRKDPVTHPNLEVELALRGQGRRITAIHLHPIAVAREQLIMLAIKDGTERRQAERSVLGEQQRLQSSLEAGAAALQETSLMLHSERLGREQVETALHASEHALLQSREELRHLSASLMHAQDAERRRVSRELHDDLSQKVAKLQFDIETL